MPRYPFKDIHLNYSDQGSGSAVVLLHGFLENLGMWQRIAKELSKKHRVICIDLPGHGKSDCISYLHTMEEMAEGVQAVLKGLKLRRFTIVGHSMGGYVALAYAEQYPDNVKALVLYQSSARSDSPEKKQDRKRAIALIKENHKSFIRKSIPLLFRPKNRTVFRTEIRKVVEEGLNTSAQGVIAALEGMRVRPNREVLLKFSPYPVHLIASDKDPRIPLRESQDLETLSDKVHLHLIKGCGHMSYIEAMEETEILFRKIISAY